jgi:hypothetical protein
MAVIILFIRSGLHHAKCFEQPGIAFQISLLEAFVILNAVKDLRLLLPSLCGGD